MKRGFVILSAVLLFIFLSSFILAQEENINITVEAGEETIGIEEPEVELNIAQEEADTNQAIADLPEPGILPTSPFYGFKTAFQNLRLGLLRREAKESYRLRLLDIRLAELNKLQELSEGLNATGKPTEKIEARIERLTEIYEKQLETSEERIEKLKGLGRNVTALQAHVANMTYKHILVLKRVSEKVPAKARIAVLRAVNRSTIGYETATKAVLKNRGLTEEEAKELLEEAKERYRERIRNITEARVCVQVITQAYNPETEECKIFASPCGIPEGWIKKPCKIRELKADVVAIRQDVKAFRQNIITVRRATNIAEAKPTLSALSAVNE